jgi:hypothetical protein
MKTIVDLMTYRDKLDPDFFDSLVAIYPKGRRHNMLRLELDETDPRMRAILDALDRYGAIPHNPVKPLLPFHYWFEGHRHYEPEDLEACDYLVPRPKLWIEDCFREHDGSLSITVKPYRGGIRSKEPIANASGQGTIVSEPIAARLADEGMEGLSFRQAIVIFKGSVDFWELRSDRTLPPLSPKMAIMGGDFIRSGWEIPDVLYLPTEYHYRQSDLANVEPFDIAFTHERIGNFGVQDLIVSHRFYRFCVANKLNVDWQRVHIDQD